MMGLKLGVAVAVILTILTPLSNAINGVYINNDLMKNQRLSIAIGSKTPVLTREDCEKMTVMHASADAYAYSFFHKTCLLYKLVVGSKTIIHKNYDLYVREKPASEGYYKIDGGIEYIKIVYDMVTAQEGQDACRKLGGNLITFPNAEVNEFARAIMMDRSIFQIFIGINDENVEGKWVSTKNGKGLPYQNWYWSGVWDRTDKNCAYMRVDGQWKHVDCKDRMPAMCLIPMI